MAGPLTARDVALAVAPGLLGLLDPTTLAPRALTAHRVGLTAVTTASALDSLDDADLGAPPAVRWLGAAAVGGLMWRTLPRWERTDARLHRWLTAHGVPRSRLVVATASTALTLGLLVAERRRAAATDAPSEEPADEAGR